MADKQATAPDYLAIPSLTEQVFDFVERAAYEESLTDLNDRLDEILHDFNIDNFILLQAYSNRREPRAEFVAGVSNTRWRSRYMEAGLACHDDVMRAGLETTAPITWSGFRSETSVRAGQQQIFDEAGEFGIRDGAVFPLHELDGSLSMVSMFAPDRLPHDMKTLAALHMLAIYYSIAVRRIRGILKPKAAEPARPVLTARQRECLQWVRAGKSDWEIAKILGLSQHTVVEHLDQARKRLGVRTRTQAVIEAIAAGLIHL